MHLVLAVIVQGLEFETEDYLNHFLCEEQKVLIWLIILDFLHATGASSESPPTKDLLLNPSS